MSALRDRYVNPLTDFGFKKLFGTEPNKILLIDFLNQVLPAHHQIADLQYARTEHLGHQEIDRKAIFDLYCTGQNGERFIVEIQKAKQNFFKDRSVYYASFPIQEQAQQGGWDFRLAPVYTVGILDFVFDDHKGDDQLLHLVELKDQNCQVFYDKLKFIYIELPKFRKTEAQLNTQFDKWLYVFRHLADLGDRPPALQEKVFSKLFDAAEIARFTPQEREQYEASLKYYRDLNNVIATSEQEGLEKGRAEGREEGRNERAVEIAREMKTAGEPIPRIIRFTGLTEEEINLI